jgi:hypothetical protein
MARSPLKALAIGGGVGLGELTEMPTGLFVSGNSFRGQPPSSGITLNRATAINLEGWELWRFREFVGLGRALDRMRPLPFCSENKLGFMCLTTALLLRLFWSHEHVKLPNQKHEFQ